MNKEKAYYPFLDAFRAIAILMVIAHHMCRGFELERWFYLNTKIVGWIYFKSLEYFNLDLTNFYYGFIGFIRSIKGILGLEIFLVISGFLITRMLLKSDLDMGGTGRFYKRRFFRIYPSYAAMVIVSISIFAWQAKMPLIDSLKFAWPYLFFLQNYFPRHPYLEHAWTLGVLEQFYLIAPLVIYSVCKVFKEQKARKIVFFMIGLGLLFVGMLVRVSYLSTGNPLFSYPLRAPQPYFTTLFHLGPIGMGALLALFEPQIISWKKRCWLGVIFWIIGASYFYYAFFCVEWNYLSGDWYLYTLGYIATALLVLAAFHGVNLISRLKFLQWMGRYSYGIYLWHILAIVFWRNWLTIIPTTLIVAASFVTCVALGVLSTKIIEKLFLDLREKV